MFPERHGGPGAWSGAGVSDSSKEEMTAVLEPDMMGGREGRLWRDLVANIMTDFYSDRDGKPLENLIRLMFKRLILAAAMRTVGERGRVQVRKPVRKLNRPDSTAHGDGERHSKGEKSLNRL